jgi:hypothetical protein
MNNTGMSSSGGAYSSSSIVTIHGIPLLDIFIVVLVILFLLYLVCRIKKKNRHLMEKSSYIKLFIVLFAPLFIYNFYNIYNSFADHSLFITNLQFSIRIAMTVSLMESLFPYLFIILSILTINCYRNSS